MRIGYLGPLGTFTQQAALIFCKDATLVACATIGHVLEAVETGAVDFGVVPLENSTEGMVNATVDGLIFDHCLFIKSQLTMAIAQQLMAKKGAITPLLKILSHGQSLAQCSRFLAQHHSTCEIVSVASNAQAAAMVASSSENWGAIGPAQAATHYGLDILQADVADEKNNETKFVLVAKNETCNLTESNKTTIAFSTENKPGELYKILDIFSLWDVNMTNIVSRPMKNKRGEYVFLVDLDVGANPKDTEDALVMVKRKTSFYKSLGCYTALH